MNQYTNLFLQQSYNDNTKLYYKLLREQNSSVRQEGARWDYVVLSASNESQASSFRAQIKARLQEKRLPKNTHFLVIPDPEGKRVGSGGATLNVLAFIHEHESRPLSSLKILVLHSGGDAKRTPQYSGCGKIFSPVPRMLPDGHRSTLFDEFMIAMCGIPARISSGLLTCSGDVELLFNPLQLDFYGEGAAAFSIKEPVETGKNHGVFYSDGGTYVSKFLHKQTVESLHSNGAVDSRGLVNIDTGAVLFSGGMVEDLYSLVDTEEKFKDLVNDHVRLSFYADFLYPLAANSTLTQFQREQPEGDFSPELSVAREKIWNKLHKYKLKLIHFSPASFLHFGTTKEVLKLVTEDIEGYKYLGWSGSVNSNYKGKSFAASNSYISVRADVGSGSYIEDSYVHHNVKIGKGCVISGVTLGTASNLHHTSASNLHHASVSLHHISGGKKDGEEQEELITIPDGVVLHGLKLKNGKFVVRVYGVQDNPKEAKWFGRDIDEPLWTKKLFKPCDTIKEAAADSLALLNSFTAAAEKETITGEYSLATSFQEADVLQILPWQEKLNDKIKVESLLEAIDNHIPVADAISIFQTGISSRVENWLLDIAETAPFSRKIRIYYYLSRISSSSTPPVKEGWTRPEEELAGKCFSTIRDTIFTEAVSNTSFRKGLHIAKDEVITRLPVRVNWGGGWSDTPPYCLEHGGTVLNAAVKLNGECPIEVTVRRLDQNKIVLESTDIGSHGEFTDIREIQECQNPSDPFALHKAALIACGVVPVHDLHSSGNLTHEESKLEESVEKICRKIGGGIYINTRVINIPKGSGLGTSSILAGACVKGLFEFFGVEISENDLYNTVLCMEQIMSTGGGWQDQVGGLAPGIKMVTADEGLEQKIVCTPVRIKQKTLTELNERFALIYTGQRRLARNLLRDIVGKYIGNDPDAVDVLYRIQQIAVLMRLELEKGHIDGFAKLLNDHWELSKKLDSGCTNTCIDQIFNSIDDLISGRMICGAGGGGFIQVILKKGVSKKELQDRLDEVFGESGVGVWEAAIN